MSLTKSPRSLYGLFLASALLVSAAGCVPLWVGAGVAGIVGGYAVSPDTVQGTLNKSVQEVWDAAYEITGIMGQISQENANASEIIATISGTRVTVTIAAVSASTTRLSVKARKAFMPKIDVAQDVYAKIVNNMDR